MFNAIMFKRMGDILIDEVFTRTAPSRIEKYKKYKITVAPHAYKSRAGCYNAKDKTIDMSDTDTACRKDTIITFIHELSHHIETVDTGASGHQDSFYKIHTMLLKKAIDLEIITTEEIQDTSTSNAANRRKLAKMMYGYKRRGDKKLSDFMDTSFLSELPDEPKIDITYKVRVPIEEKDRFKERRYHWAQGDKAWYKIVDNLADKKAEEEFLSQNGYMPIAIEGLAYFTKYITLSMSGDTYIIKDILSDFGYKFDGSQWNKTIPVGDISLAKKEIEKLKGVFVAARDKLLLKNEDSNMAKKNVIIKYSFNP